MDRQDLQSQLAALATGYREQLALELPELLRLAETRPLTDAGCAQLEQRLHKLAGSAGTFGYPALGEQARKLELLCRSETAGDPLASRLSAGLRHMLRLSGHQPTASSASSAEPEHRAEEPAQRVALLVPGAELNEQLGNTLGNFGYRIEQAEAEDVLQQGLQPSCDALIVDLDALEDAEALLQRLAERQHQRPRTLPLLLISSRDDFQLQLLGVRAGASGFFAKPVDLTALENRLENSLRHLRHEAFRVLVVDDDQQLATRYLTVLSAAGMRCELLQQPELLLPTMHSFQPDVVLMDINMPEVSGIELARMIRLHDSWLRVPIIYLSAEQDSDRQMSALLRAGDDFISKPISDQQLLTSVSARVQRARMISQALARDSLTGLLKHADIKEQLLLECERALRNQQPLSLVMLDLDHFKQVNDNHGHAAGDNVIRALSNLLRQRLRRLDRIGRYGGEEFVALLPNCAASDAATIIDGIRQSFAQLQFSGPQGNFQCSFSAGIASCEAPLWRTEQLLERADQQLYRAKRAGRNCLKRETD